MHHELLSKMTKIKAVLGSHCRLTCCTLITRQSTSVSQVGVRYVCETFKTRPAYSVVVIIAAKNIFVQLLKSFIHI